MVKSEYVNNERGDHNEGLKEITFLARNDALTILVRLGKDRGTSTLPFRFSITYCSSPTMILRSNCLRASSRSVSTLLPDFLVPALCPQYDSRHFSSTSRTRSRIGSAPLSLPQGVDLRFLEPPAKRRQNITTTEPPKTVEIIGPLGMWV